MAEYPFVVAALYQFVRLEDYEELQQPLTNFCRKNGIKGTLLLAREGINGTVAGSRQGIDALKAYFAQDGRFDNLEYKESWAETMPFYRLKIRLKKEIVTIGIPDVDPNEVVGTYLNPKEWNELIQDPDVIVLDTRNDYEVDIGTFKNALDPKTKSFSEFPDYVRKNLAEQKKKKIAMFCTGGIRCEKASSFMKQEGFDEVYHLKGGILKYIETIAPQESLWEGECFVFDNRVAVKHGLELGSYDLCHGCRQPITLADKESPLYEPGVCCGKCAHTLTPSQKKRFQERHKQVILAQKRNQRHIGEAVKF